jgi:geranylgeranyl diphosphate synthase type II
MDAEGFLAAAAKRTETELERYITGWNAAAQDLDEAIRYSLFANGKRLRPALVLGAAELVAGDSEPALPVACALEMIHTYSLIHDDLPAMDDDDLRRGKPSLHKSHGEALAILAGDALLTMAFDLAADAGHLDIIHEIAQAAGVAGMVGGQVLDLQSEGVALTVERLEQIHHYKTGALIRCSVRCGALIAGADQHQLQALTVYGETIGLAFQIADDILDVSGDEAVLGKRTGADAAHAKVTYPALVGLERAKELAREAQTKAQNALKPFGAEADMFRALAAYVVDRVK